AKLSTLIRDDAYTSDCVGASPTTTTWFTVQVQSIPADPRELKSTKVIVGCDFNLVSPLGALLQLATRGPGSQASTIPLQADAVFPVRALLGSDLPSAETGTPEPAPTASLSGSFGCVPSSGTTPL